MKKYLKYILIISLIINIITFGYVIRRCYFVVQYRLDDTEAEMRNLLGKNYIQKRFFWDYFMLCVKDILGIKYEIYFVGDSITFYFKPTTWFKDYNIKSISSNDGWATEDVEKFAIPQLKKNQPQKVVLLIGINNFTLKQESIANAKQAYIRLLNNLQNQLPKTEFIIQSILPTTTFWAFLNDSVNQLNVEIKKQCELRKLKYINLHDIFLKNNELNHDLCIDVKTSGLHLNRVGNQLWVNTITPYLNQ